MSRPKETLRALLESRPRRLVVIGLTFVIGLVTLLPAADEYLALFDRGREASSQLAEARQQVARLGWLESTATAVETELTGYQRRAIDEPELHELRGWLADTARATGCHLRKSEPQEVHQRTWYQNDHPLRTPSRSTDDPETPYTLTTQAIRLTLAGTLPEVWEFLAQLEARQHLMHTSRFRMHPDDRQSKEVVLDLELMLFHLGPRTQEPSA